MKSIRIQAVWLGLFLSACGPKPTEILEEIQSALARHEVGHVHRFIHARYADALGDRARLLADLERLSEEFAVLSIAFEDLATGEADDPRNTIRLRGRLNVDLTGTSTFKLSGPLDVEFLRSENREVRSGLLGDVRDVRELLAKRRAAFEANDADAYEPLLHLDYRDGDLRRADLLARLRAELPGIAVRQEILHHRVEVRDDLAHVDEHYRLRADDHDLGVRIARFTLKKELGRWKFAAGLSSP